jgi:sugar lactone lactonase YvrE
MTSTLAGSGGAGSTDATGTLASFNRPSGLAVDASGNVYVADQFNNKIRKITPDGVVTTFAGRNNAGRMDGTGAGAAFSSPTDVAIDPSGNIYVADASNNKIRKITPAAVVTTFAGTGQQGYFDATGTAAIFNSPTGVATDAAGNIYVADQGNSMIRKITPAGVVTTLAGNGGNGSSDGTGTAASFYNPWGVATDAWGNIYVADTRNNKIRMITPTGVVSTLAGNGTAGFADGAGTTASFNFPLSVATDAAGNIYVADGGNNRIRKIAPGGVVTTLAGNGTAGAVDGFNVNSFNSPYGVATDAFGNIYVADRGNNTIRKVLTH